MFPDFEFEDVEVDDSSSEEDVCANDGSDKDIGYVDYNDAPIAVNTIKGMTFASTGETGAFYKVYGRRMGFTTRKCHTERDRTKKIIKNRKWECSSAGFRKPPVGGPKGMRKSKSDTRCGCKVSFRVALQNGIYIVTSIESEHNHELLTVKTAMKAKTYISPGNQSPISTLSSAGIKTSKILDILKQVEGPSNLTFTNKDTPIFLANQGREFIKHGDASTTLYLLDGMKLNDKDFFYAKELGDDGSINKLFWTDGLGRAQYNLFGDALVFDSAYQTNTYKFPLVIFSGIDNNMRTCVFGGALIHNETYETFVWLLQTFLEVMGGKAPISVVTDEDGAMRKAIHYVFRGSKNRLCNWHLGRNCRKHIRVGEFCNEFSKLTKVNLSIDQFERAWKRITETHGVAENSWVLETYSKREIWARAYFRGHFTGMMRSNQRAESMNPRFKVHGKKGYNLCEFLKHFFYDLHNLRLSAYESQCESELPEKSPNRGALH